MTDNTSIYTQNYTYPEMRFSCYLDEGDITVSTAYDQQGKEQKVCTYQYEIHEGDIVAISNSTSNTYAATEGSLLVEKPINSESLVIGKIVGLPGRGKVPAADADADSLSERLSGGYLRTALVEVFAFHSIIEGVIMCNGIDAHVPGVGTTLQYNITSGYTNHGLYFDSSNTGGGNAIPLHYVPAGTDGDLYSALIGVIGMIPAVTGA